MYNNFELKISTHLHKSQTYHSNEIVTLRTNQARKTFWDKYIALCVKLSHGDNFSILNGLEQQCAPNICHRSSKLQKHHKTTDKKKIISTIYSIALLTIIRTKFQQHQQFQ